MEKHVLSRSASPHDARPGTSTPPSSTALLRADSHSPLPSPGLDYTPPVAPFARERPVFASRSTLRSTYSDSPYGDDPALRHRVSSYLEKYTLDVDPQQWGTAIGWDAAEDDDALHAPERDARALDRNGGLTSVRGAANLGCIVLIVLVLLALFLAYPVTTFYTTHPLGTLGAFGLGGTNASGQVPVIANGRALIDPDTPPSAYTRPSWTGADDMVLVFSDEFTADGRTFYPGDDPFWEAVDLHYWPTGNLEWYDPATVTTGGGSLAITFSANAEHGLNYTGGMLQSWNKFCFTGGYIEASVMLPGYPQYRGMWPAIWTMGNLGRAGYGATTDGLWPYTYDACDVGTLPNQTFGGPNPYPGNYGAPHLSEVVGQRLSRCTCPADAALHPGPRDPVTGEFVGRSAPEIDVFEQQVGAVAHDKAEVSQSGQWAPFNVGFDYETGHDGDWEVYNSNITIRNSFNGTILQQATSYVTEVDQNCFERSGQCYSVYGFEYKPGFASDGGYITWISNNQEAWTIDAAAMGPDATANISARPVPMEPMYILLNLGMSPSFAPADPHLLSTLPITMYIDYIRVYQPAGATNIGCDPPGFPTAAYIDKYSDAYTNPNFTIWDTATDEYQSGFNQTKPRNRLVDQC